MAWTVPMTAGEKDELTAAEFNTHIRDNLLETMPAKASVRNSYFVADGPNTIVERQAADDFISTGESTTSGSYTDLATVGPEVSVDTGTSAIVCFSSQGQEIGGNDNFAFRMSIAVSGATSMNASVDWQWQWDGFAAGNWVSGSRHYRFTGLTPGTNTFTMKYSASQTGTDPEAEFRFRHLLVMPF